MTHIRQGGEIQEEKKKETNVQKAKRRMEINKDLPNVNSLLIPSLQQAASHYH